MASAFGTAALEQLVVWLYVAIGLRLLWHTGWRHGAKVLAASSCVVVDCSEPAMLAGALDYQVLHYFNCCRTASIFPRQPLALNTLVLLAVSHFPSLLGTFAFEWSSGWPLRVRPIVAGDVSADHLQTAQHAMCRYWQFLGWIIGNLPEGALYRKRADDVVFLLMWVALVKGTRFTYDSTLVNGRIYLSVRSCTGRALMLSKACTRAVGATRATPCSSPAFPA